MFYVNFGSNSVTFIVENHKLQNKKIFSCFFKITYSRFLSVQNDFFKAVVNGNKNVPVVVVVSQE